jgi:hypothetical protein
MKDHERREGSQRLLDEFVDRVEQLPVEAGLPSPRSRRFDDH